jgi:hypothetical protein
VRAQLNPKVMEAQSRIQQTDTVTELIRALAEQQSKQSEQFQQALTKMLAALNAPKRIIRDGSGRAVGTEAVRQ